jgi:serine/threonine protein kinase
MLVGVGAYGIVVAALDKEAEDEEEQYVAIKKIEKAFEHTLFTKRTLRELKFLRLLKHENVSQRHIRSSNQFRSYR